MNRYYESDEIAKFYVKFRPRYPIKIAELLLEFYTTNHDDDLLEKPDLLVDVGCGSGQSSEVFSPYFKRIVAVDVSMEQLKYAKKQNQDLHVEFVEGTAENLPIASNSADVVVAGSAAHWFDLPKFYDEVKRILKPTGCLGLFGYWNPRLLNNGSCCLKASELLEQVILRGVEDDHKVLKTYLNIKSHYKYTFDAMPFVKKQRIDNIKVNCQWSMNDVLGFMRSTDSYYSYMDRKIKELKERNESIKPENAELFDFAVKFSKDLRKLWKLETNSDNAKIMEAQFDFFILLAKV